MFRGTLDIMALQIAGPKAALSFLVFQVYFSIFVIISSPGLFFVFYSQVVGVFAFCSFIAYCSLVFLPKPYKSYIFKYLVDKGFVGSVFVPFL